MWRQPAHLEARERVLIVTEGSKTEPDCFRRLIRELGLTAAQVKVTGDGDPTPISVVQYTQDLLKEDAEYEHVFLVFDRDRHTTYNKALTMRRRNSRRVEIKEGNLSRSFHPSPVSKSGIFFMFLTVAGPIKSAVGPDHQLKI